MTALSIATSNSNAQDAAPRHLKRDGLKLELAALAPDQVRAFFMARGFAKKDAEIIVRTACVFRSAIGSGFDAAGAPEVSVSQLNWQVIPAGGAAVAPKTRDHWEKLWLKRAIAEDARVAFYWALFPATQNFAASDYNWGFLTFGLPPGTKFSLRLTWRTGDADHSTTLENLKCGL